MGICAVKSKALWLRYRPAACDPYRVQEGKVLAKFDRVLRVLEMTHEEGKLFYELFSKIDVDFSGDVDIWEFADFYELTLSLFIQRLFKQLDLHGKGGLFFGEYLFSIWNLGTLSYKEMLVFVYNLYDEGRTGLLSKDTMRNIVLEMYELDMRVDERIPQYLLKMVDVLFLSKLARAQAPFATIECFAKFSEKYPEFMKHAFALQRDVVNKSLTPQFWHRAKELRRKMAISLDPQSFYLYIRDLAELGNEKNVTRKGGDADSDLDGSDSDDKQQSNSDDGSRGGDSEEKKEATDVVKFQSKKVVNKRMLRRQVAAKSHSAVVLPLDHAVAEQNDLEELESGRKSSSKAGAAPTGSQGHANFDELDGPYSGKGSEALEIVTTAGNSVTDSGFLSPPAVGSSTASPSIVGPLFSPDSLHSPGGLSRSPAKRSKLGKPKIAVAKDPKWHY